MSAALAEPRVSIRPQQGPQEMFLSSVADIAIYGGAAGGGKTFALLMEPLYNVHNPRFGAVIFRRTFPQIEREGGMWDESFQLYPYVGGQPNKSDMSWRFPSGARVAFSHLQHSDKVEDWKGAQIPLLMFDQLEEHEERVFFYMLSRNRSTSGIRPYVRATVNPDPESWVARFIEWWIDQDEESPTYGLPIRERAGVLRWFARMAEKWIWGDTRDEVYEQTGGIEPKSVTFIPARLEDNPILMQRDPGYRANLLAQSYVDQARLLGGNWKIKAAAGKVFNRAWFEIVDAVPAGMGGEECTGWDLAATEAKNKGDDPDYTAALTMLRAGGVYYVTDFLMERVGPAQVDTLMKNTTIQRAAVAQSRGSTYRVRWEREPGSSGKRDNLHIVQMLAGYDAMGKRPQGDKLVRAKPFAAQAYAGNVKLLRAPWNEMLLQHLHAQPDAAHDDGMDAGSVAFNDLAMYVQQ